MKALTFSEFGSSEVMEYTDVPDPVLRENEVLVSMRAIGLNYADIYRRVGNYPIKGRPPYIAGYEGAGKIVASNSHLYSVGDKVAFTDFPFANAELVAVNEDHIIPLPEGVSYELAATSLLQGLTAQYLAQDSHLVKPGEFVLIHSAAGGVGQILTQVCKIQGANVIALTRSEEKIEIIKENGADFPLVMDDNWKEEVLDITDNVGVDVAYDGIGSTLMDSFAITRDCGKVVFFGMVGGNPEPVDPRFLMDTSKTLTGGDLWNYLTSAEERIRRSELLFDWILNGDILIREAVKFDLKDGKFAHEYLESGKSTGKVLMIPEKK